MSDSAAALQFAAPTLRNSESLEDEKFQSSPSASSEWVASDVRKLDVAVTLAAGHANDPVISTQESLRVRRKLDWHILPLLSALYCVQFIDKQTLASSSILGILVDASLSTDDYNTLGSAFYIGYLIFVWPQNWALQHFPVGKWLTLNIFLWCVFLGLHPVCTNFSGLFALRFFLGATEASITAGLMLVTSMFYTRVEISERIGWVFLYNGVAVIISGFIAYGVAHIDPTLHPRQWQWMFIITVILTLIVFAFFLLFFPDNPTTARFLTTEEKLIAVKRTQENQNGIETKVWKREQFIEAICDIKLWLFFLYAVFSTLPDGIGVQYSLIINELGFNQTQSTVLNIPSGFSQVIGILLGTTLMRRFPNHRAWLNLLFWIPCIVSAIVQLSLPLENKVGHLVAIYLFYLGGSVGFVIILSWVTSTVAGHTKKTTINGIFLVGYALGQILCTQFWKVQYRPLDMIPWGIGLAFQIATVVVGFAIRYVLKAENERRDRLYEEAVASGNTKLIAEFDEFGYLETEDEKGVKVKRKVEKALLDVTDKQNLAFRYVL